MLAKEPLGVGQNYVYTLRLISVDASGRELRLHYVIPALAPANLILTYFHGQANAGSTFNARSTVGRAGEAQSGPRATAGKHTLR